MYCTNLRVSRLYDENDCLLSENKDVTLVRVYKSGRRKGRRYRGQVVLRSHAIILHAVSWGRVHQPRSFGHGHVVGR